MKLINGLVVIFFVNLLTACTQLSSRPDSVFDWEKHSYEVGYQETYRNIREGFRRCSVYYVTSELYTDKKQGFIELYAKTLWNSKSEVGVGVIYVDANGESASEVRLAKYMFTKHLSKWIPAFVRRDYSVCQ